MNIKDYYIKEGIICADCYKQLNQKHGFPVLCTDCYLIWISDGITDCQCELT